MTDALAPPQLVWARAERFVLEPYEEIAPAVSPYLVKGLLPRRGVAFIVGAPRAGKTFIALDQALSIATGAQVMGRRARQVGVVYVAAEDPEGCRARVDAWRSTHPRTAPTPFMLVGGGPNLTDPGEVAELIGALGRATAAFAGQGLELGLVVFDTLSRCLPGVEENSSEQMSLAFAALEEIGAATGALTLVVAHHGKDVGRGIRGWSGMDAGSDATLSVVRDEETGARTVTLTKVKNGEDGAVVGFQLRPVELSLADEDGEARFSCVVAYDGAAAAPKAAGRARPPRALADAEEVVLTALGRMLDHGPTHHAPASVRGVRKGTMAVRPKDLARDARDTGLDCEGESDGAYRKRFTRAIAGLAAKKRIRVHGDSIWMI